MPDFVKYPFELIKCLFQLMSHYDDVARAVNQMNRHAKGFCIAAGNNVRTNQTAGEPRDTALLIVAFFSLPRTGLVPVGRSRTGTSDNDAL